MRNSKKTIAGIMAFAMILSLASCSGGGSSESSTADNSGNNSSQGGESSAVTAETVASKSYKAIDIDTTLPLNYIGSVLPMHDVNSEKLLVTGSTDDGSAMYITDYDFMDFTPVNFEVSAEEDADTYYNAVPLKDGSILVFASITTYGDIEKPDLEDPDFDYDDYDWDAYYDAAENSYKIYNIDIEGVVVSENELTGLDQYVDPDEDEYYLSSFYPCGDGAMLEIGSNTGDGDIMVFVGTDGVIGDKIELEEESDIYNFYTNALDKDGNFCFAGYSDGGNVIKKVDTNTLSVSSDDKIRIEDGELNYVQTMFTGSGDYEFYINDSTSLFGLKADGSLTEVINWLDSDLNGNYIDHVFAVENDEFIVIQRDWNTNTTTFSRLTKRDPSELENVQILNMVVQYEDTNISEIVSKFNKSNDKYRIKIESYDKYYEWDENYENQLNSPENQLKLDIAAGKKLDIIYMSGNSAILQNLGKNGAFADMYELMGTNGTVSKDDILPNVLEAGEINGKLAYITNNFSVNTMAVKKKFCDKENWTIDDMIETFNSVSDDMRFSKYSRSKTDILGELATSGGFIDYNNASCSFGSDEFIKVLEFCNSLENTEEPDYDNMNQSDWEAYYKEQELAIRNDKALIDSNSIYSLDEYARKKYGEFNEEMCFVGIPSNDGVGAQLVINNCFAIMADSANKEAAWEFINMFFEEDYVKESIYSIPALKTVFEQKLDETMEKPYYIDSDGKKHEYENTYFIQGSDEEIKLPQLSQEERDEFEEYILSAKSKSTFYNANVYKMIDEEAEKYFNGECSAEDAANKMQNRISILLSEQF